MCLFTRANAQAVSGRKKRVARVKQEVEEPQQQDGEAQSSKATAVRTHLFARNGTNAQCDPHATRHACYHSLLSFLAMIACCY